MIQCFMLVRTGRTVRSLRRFTWTKPDGSGTCTAGFGYHNALVPMDVVDQPPDQIASGDYWPHGDPRWPAACGCGYRFQPDDPWQVFHEGEYQVDGTHELVTLRTARVGAMWWADWMADGHGSKRHQARGGGPHLIVKTPVGDWDVDGPSDNGDGWDREGTPPYVTVRPSIGFQDAKGGWRFHAWLTNGQLVPC